MRRISALANSKLDASFLVLYGSQLGQAQSIAEGIFNHVSQQHLAVIIKSLNEVKEIADLRKINIPIVIVTSTTGDGEAPENSDKFLRKLRRRTLDSATLQGVQYAILGLGDTNFNNFCNCAKIVHSRFQEVGAELFYPAAWADDAVGSDDTINSWLEGLWPALNQLLGTQPKSNCILHPISNAHPTMTSLTLPSCPESIIEIDYHGTGNSPDVDLLSPPEAYPSIEGIAHVACLTEARILTNKGSVKTTIEVTLTLKDKNEFQFEPGDAIGIICPNPEAEVSQLLEHLDIPKHKVDETVELVLRSGVKGRFPSFIPKKSTLRNIFTYYVDIRTPPKKILFRVLAEFTSDPIEKSTLLKLSSREGIAEYEERIRLQGVSIVDVLLKFPSCRPNPDILLQHLTRLVPRSYSIASSPLDSSSWFRIAFNLVIIPATNGRMFPRMGLCTGWLSNLTNSMGLMDRTVDVALQSLSLTDTNKKLAGHKAPANPSLVFYKRRNHFFRLPEERRSPVIMVGPGTGVAPFVGFLRHREIEGSQGVTCGPMILYFGCRNKEKDFIYNGELEKLIGSTLTNLYVAFSRDDGEDLPKYVQDLMDNRKEELVHTLLEGGAYFYVCGDARNMAKQVREKLNFCIQQVKGISEKEAGEEITRLVDCKKYLQDIWT